MTLAERALVAEKFFTRCTEVLTAKGKDYAPAADACANFKRISQMTGASTFEVWSIYFLKHVDSILNAIRENPALPSTGCEAISERAVDVANYALILVTLVDDAVVAAAEG